MADSVRLDLKHNKMIIDSTLHTSAVILSPGHEASDVCRTGATISNGYIGSLKYCSASIEYIQKMILNNAEILYFNWANEKK